MKMLRAGTKRRLFLHPFYWLIFHVMVLVCDLMNMLAETTTARNIMLQRYMSHRHYNYPQRNGPS